MLSWPTVFNNVSDMGRQNNHDDNGNIPCCQLETNQNTSRDTNNCRGFCHRAAINNNIYYTKVTHHLLVK